MREKGKHADTKREKGKATDREFVPDLTLHPAARTHARHETKRFPGWGRYALSPQPPIKYIKTSNIFPNVTYFPNVSYFPNVAYFPDVTYFP